MSEIRTSEETTNKDISGINATFVPLQTNLNTTVDSAQQNQHDIPMPVALKLAHPSPQAPVDTGSKSIQMITPNIQNRQISQYYPCSSLAKETVIAASPFSQRLSELETEKLHYETEVEKLRKIKRLQAAKLRQLSKEKCGLPESTQQSNEEDMAKQLNEVSEAQKTFDSTKKAVLYTQRQLEKCKARIREHTSVVESVNLNQKQEFSSLAYLSSSGPTPYHPQPSVIQNQPPDQFIQEPLLQSNSASIKSMNQSLPNTPFHPSVKSTRGRKRKNVCPLPHDSIVS
jgi:hypothetical protein